MNLKQDIIELIRNGDRIKSRAIEILKNLPNNPEINRLSSNSFVINSSQLRDNWSPEFHDWKAQYKLIIQIISKASIESLVILLKEIISQESIRLPGHTQKLHPEVIRLLKENFDVGS